MPLKCHSIDHVISVPFALNLCFLEVVIALTTSFLYCLRSSGLLFMITDKARATGEECRRGRVMKDKELKLVEVNASLTLMERGRSCPGRGKWTGCKCYLLTDTHSRRISLAEKRQSGENEEPVCMCERGAWAWGCACVRATC